MPIADGAGLTALHHSALWGHLAVTKLLAKAGAELNTTDKTSSSPLHLCTEVGHTGVMRALREASANLNSRNSSQHTPLFRAAKLVFLGAVKVLLRTKADPSLGVHTRTATRVLHVPLDVAASFGHADVVRELIQQVGIDACGGVSGGLQALCLATRNCDTNCSDVLSILTDAGVVGTGDALCGAAARGNEEAAGSSCDSRGGRRRRRGRRPAGRLTSTQTSLTGERPCCLR